MLSKLRSRLDFKVGAAIAVVVVAVVATLLYVNLSSMRSGTQENIKASGLRLADATYSGILHPMSMGDNATVETQLLDAHERMPGVNIHIFGPDLKVAFTSRKERLGSPLAEFIKDRTLLSAIGQAVESGDNIKQAFEEQSDGHYKQAIIRPILNAPACHHCHGAGRRVLGALMVRQVTDAEHAQLASLRNINIGAGVAGGLIILALLYMLLSYLVLKPVGKVVAAAEAVAAGDLTYRLNLRNDDEVGMLARAFDCMVSRFSEALANAGETATRVAEGASEQAASVQETSSSLEEISSMVRQNADNAARVKQLVDETREVAGRAYESMQEMTRAMEDISSASSETGKIIKTIDEIAFQTNLLALNAAVEAARAGEAGMGFAVVADEVRNLAQRAAQAAGSTADLIEGTIKKVTLGYELVTKTHGIFEQVTKGSEQVGELVAEITVASQEQARGIEQVNIAVAQMDKVVQQNAAGAEEIASAIAAFRTGEDGGTWTPNPSALQRPPSAAIPDIPMPAAPTGARVFHFPRP